MATVVQPGVIAPARVRQEYGLWSWITTIDHKRIGLMYGGTALFFLLAAGLEALIIRSQLIGPNMHLVSPNTYNELFTMHGTTMIFFAIMPLGTTVLGNYLVPLMIGARDVAFPRLNAFSYWIFLAGGILINLGWAFGAAPNTGWYGYAPVTELPFSPGRNVDFYDIGLIVAGIGTVAAALNFIVTIINLRAPGLSMMKLPLFVWGILVTSILTVLAFPSLTVALIYLFMDRYAGTHFFLADVISASGTYVVTGGDPLLWQHLFWIFGHPEVYIMILPAFGIISEIVPVFSRKPIFGYVVMVYSFAAIAILSFSVWAHHMFPTGMGATADSVFSATSMLIAIPTGIKIFSWLGTMFFGQIRFTTPMLFAIGFVSMFTIGGISGVMQAAPPIDLHQNDSYLVVAHFHYVLFGGTMFGILAGVYYWFPKITGHLMSERLGKLNFWWVLISFNVTFFPMHFLGLEGMPRRYYTYGASSGWGLWSLVASIGSYFLGASFLLLLYNIIHSWHHGQVAGADPWDGATLEWLSASPPPAYNFETIPNVTHRDEMWWRKYGRSLANTGDERVRVTVAGHEVGQTHAPDESPGKQAALRNAGSDTEPRHIHMPNPSYYPFFSGIGLFIIGLGLLVSNPILTIGLLHLPWLCVAGGVILFWGLYGWALEPAAPPEPGEPQLAAAGEPNRVTTR